MKMLRMKAEKEAPSAEFPEAEPDFTKYGWKPSPMEGAETAESPFERDAFTERRNPPSRNFRSGILEGLLHKEEA